MSLKTLHLTNAWHGTSGGIGTFYRALLASANQKGCHMALVVPGEKTDVEQCGPFGKIYYIEAPRAPFDSGYRMLYPHRFLFPGTAIQRILNDERPDVVEVSEKYTMPYLAHLLRIQSLRGVDFRPTVIGLTCERMDDNVAAYLSSGKYARWLCGRYMKWIYFPGFDHHIAVSEHAAAELRPASRGHKIRRGVWVRPMGVDCDGFSPARRSKAVRARLLQLAGGDAKSRLAVYAGRLAPEKNLGLLLDTLAALGPDWRLLLAGQGVLMDSLKASCDRRLPGRVTFLGHLGSRGELADLLANGEVFVHPNPREPFGIAPLEAMASGLAVVAPNQGGVTSYANDTNAWLADPQPAAFAAAVLDAAQESSLKQRKLAAALTTAHAHAWPCVAAQFHDLYAELHALTRGEARPDSAPAQFYSTQGNLFGREIAWQ